MIRLRSHPKLLGYLQNIIKYYPDEWKGELIPHMARVRDEIRDKQAKKDIEGYLTEITGYKYEKWDDYLKWHRRWEQVIQIGIAQKKEEIPDLLNYYKSTKRSFPLKKTIIWALQQCKAKEAIPSFLEDLNNPDPRVRLAAYNAFRSFFVEYPPKFDPNGSQTARTDQVAAILDWYQEQQKKDTAAAQTGG
jgi:hypothetical protein